MPARRVDEEVVNEGVPPQGGQAPQGVQVPQGEQVSIVELANEFLVVPPNMTNEEIREAFFTLARAMTTQANRDVELRMNALQSTMTSRLRDFVG